MNPLDLIETKLALNAVAEILWSFYRDLVEQGFTEEQALEIAIAWHESLFNAKESE